ncbi:tandem-95 repeat protein [Mycobacterium sp. URHB0044]|uniref:Ig-like domain-containing protein n=1 Tax=Mycobacterium sp. URHB0044 TaxID=1380386 RepID=UPI0006889D21|nr:tandem-95 repeat protein [Mycobacterium sp. URHB0044]
MGRIGALAVALGVGSAIAAPAGIAWANPDTTTDSPSVGSQGAEGSTDTSSPSTAGETATQPGGTGASPSAPTTPATRDAGKGSSTTVEVAPGVTVSSSGGATASTHDGGPTPEDASTDDTEGQSDAPEETVPDASAPEPDPSTPKPTAVASPSHSNDSGRPSGAAAASDPAPQPTTSIAAQTSGGGTTAVDDVTPPVSPTSGSAPAAGTITATELAVATAPTAAAPPAQNPIETTITTVLRNIVTPVFSEFLAALQRGWTESPLAWMFLAAARREVGPTTAPTADAGTLQMAAAQTVSTAVVNEPPTAQAVFTTPNPTTGAVTGRLVGSDAEGAKVTFTLTAKPTVGTLVYNSTTATFTYTPTTAQRILAGATAQADTIAMTITASDGTTTVPVQIDIPIGAIPIAVRTDVPGVSGAGAVAATNTRAYVTNRDAGTVTVIDTLTGTVVGTFAAGVAPDGIAVKQTGTRLYVSSSTNNTVTVIDTATGAVKATIAVATPSALTMSPSGGVVYVTNYDTATVTRISTSTNKIDATIKLPIGSHPTGIAVSPDTTKIYVTSTTETGATTVLVFASSSRTAAVIGGLSSSATGLVVSPDNSKLYVSAADGSVTVIDVKTRAVVRTIQVGGVPTGVAISKDGTTIVVTDDAGRVAAFDASSGTMLDDVATRGTSGPLSQRPAAAISPDGTELYVTDYDTGVVHVVSLTAPNARPTAGTPTTGVPSTTSGAITGTVGVTDADGDPLTYSVSGAPTKGKVVLNANGTFTYTPTAAARHAASAVNAPSTVTGDSFTVTVSDGRRGVVTTTITVAISPTNKVPTVSTTVGTPNSSTGVVTGSVKGTDGDYDVVTYTPTAPAKGTVTFTATGGFTYTPTAAARHAAMKPGATTADKQDAFTVTVADGHGGVVTVTVAVKISPANAAPTGGSGTVTQTDPRTGVVTGNLSAVDLDGDALTYTAATPKKGTLVIGANGRFTYTPTVAARDAASAEDATAASKAEAIAITVTDGYGGTATFTLTVSIEPYPPGNRPPGNGHATVATSTSAIGTVTGTVSATDPEGDPLTYTVTGGPTKGVVTLNPTTGAFSYTPTVDARYTALVTPGVDIDTFTVTVSDGLGGTTVMTVGITIAPPSATAVDQRPTNVAIHAPDLLFYSQTDLNRALQALQDNGIDTVRVMIPWAAVEPLPGWYDWSAVDRVVNSATLRGIKVLGILNSTPIWAIAPGTLPISGQPNDPAQFANFARLVATRYKGKVANYEVWNEPNGIQFWMPTPNAAQYTTLLKAAYTAIKTADPNAMVIGGVVGATLDWPGLTVNPVRFISEMYAAGAAGYFDALSFHPYLYNNPFSQGSAYDSPLNQAKRIYALMVANGDGNKKIWATEYGQPSSVVSEANQASFTGDFLRTWRDLPFAGPAFLHTLLDTTGSDPVEASMGLFHPDWTPKPVLATVVQVIAENNAIEAAQNVL